VTVRDSTYVRAARDIRRGDHTVVVHGSPGRVLCSHPSWFETTYTVNFTGTGSNHRGAITLIGLNTDDVKPRRPNKSSSDNRDPAVHPPNNRAHLPL